MFRTVFPSIIRSSKLQTWQQAYVKQLLLPAASEDEMDEIELQFHFVPSSSSQQQLFDICLLPCGQFRAPDDRLKDHPKHVERVTRINNLRNSSILLVVL